LCAFLQLYIHVINHSLLRNDTTEESEQRAVLREQSMHTFYDLPDKQ
jgi:hypothetical protein